MCGKFTAVKMGSIGRMSEFNPYDEEISSYLLRLKHYFKANDVKEEKQVSILITVIGPKILSVLSDILSPKKVDDKSFKELSDILIGHYSPKRLVVAERYLFYSRCQKPTETISEFVVAIKHLASTCEFSSFLLDALRDKLISGINNENIRQKLLSEELDFEKTFALALRFEQAEKQTGMFASHPVHAISNMKRNTVGNRPSHMAKSVKPSGNKVHGEIAGQFKCFRCAKVDHKASDCPYSNYKCHVCKKVGHLGKVCKAKGGKVDKFSRGANYKVHQMASNVQEDRSSLGLDDKMEKLALFNIGLNESSSGYKVRLNVENVPIIMELDTGSALTICPYELYLKYFSHVKLNAANIKLLTYSGNEVRVTGQALVKVTYNKECYHLSLVVVEIERPNQPMLLGRDWLKFIRLDWKSIFVNSVSSIPKSNVETKLNRPRPVNLSLVDELKQRFLTVFQGGPGEIKDVKARIVLKEGAIPKFFKHRPVPYALRQAVEDELERMISEGIAYSVTSSDWATPLVVVQKPKGVRLCADFKVSLNSVIQTEHYPLPQPEDIFASLAGCSYFSVLDLEAAYLQLAVEEESQELLTLATHKGLVRLRRLPYGLSSAPALFQMAMDKIISGLPGTVAYLDDVLIGGSTEEEAYSRLEKVLQRLEQYGVKVNDNKCKFLQPTVQYLGYCLSSEGISPQDSILDAIKKAPEPSNKEELRAYVGLINFYGKFICNLSDKISCFYDLLVKDKPWVWSKTCSNTFQQSKSWVLSSDVLVHYDVKKPLILTCDASPRGVGAILSHCFDGVEKPIAFASKSLSASEKNYSQLHKEALALVFGVKKFHKYIYGRPNVILQTDHAPLVTIFGNKRGVPCVAAARLQRWALILSAYNFEVKYRKGTELPHADALSRLPLPDSETLELDANYISHVDNCLEVFCNKLVSDDTPTTTSKDVAKLTGKDPILAKVLDFVWHGWREVNDPELVLFSRKKDELSVENGCILWGSRVIIPVKLRNSILRLLHDQHPGINRMKMLARSYVWWPGLDKDIEDTVSSCTICQCTRNSASRVPLQQWPRASVRWQRVHIDYAEDTYSRQQMLIVVDSFSKWVEVFRMPSTTSFKTIERLRTLFASFGLPEEVVTDNGTNFTSGEFREFLKKNGVKFTLTPPYHPASNGAAERVVQEVKKSLQRQVMASKEVISLQHKLDNFLFAYRNTPNTITGLTPSELFLQWKPRTKLTLLKPNLLVDIDKKKDQQKKAADSHRGVSRSFVEGEKVLVKTVRQERVSWLPGRIMEKRSLVTYLVTVFGKTRFCHADHLRASHLEEEDIAINKPLEVMSPKPQSPSKTLQSPNKTLQSPSVERSPVGLSQENGNLPKSPTFQRQQHQQLVEDRPATLQCSPPQLRRSDRVVRQPKRLDL